MTPPVFLTDPGGLAADTVVLSGAEGRHAASVRRIEAGETVHLADGEGTRAVCVVTSVGKDSIVCEVGERIVEPAPVPRLTVVQALPKGDRGELAVEVMTEAGVDAVVPWAAERCVTRWKPERTAKALAKWRATAREAAKQARRSRVPRVDDPVNLRGAVALVAGADLAVVLHEGTGIRLASLEVPRERVGGGAAEVVLVVGPEGGFGDAELAAFDAAGAVRALLGPTVLRTSTAGVAALAVVQAACGRW